MKLPEAIHHPMFNEVEETLASFGGFYKFQDIIDAVNSGMMQSFVLNDSWIVTQVCVFPQKRAVDIVLAVGNAKELESLHSDVEKFALSHGATLLLATGRHGWKNMARNHGWRSIAAVYVKDLV